MAGDTVVCLWVLGEGNLMHSPHASNVARAVGRPLLKGGPTGLGGGTGGWVRGLWVGGWVSFILGDLALRAYSPPPGGGGGSGWVGGWVSNLCCCFLCFQLQRRFF